MNSKEKLILYLTFAKSKLNLKSEKHREAKEDIDNLIQEIKESENK